jgi:hypothetical protein
LSEPSEPTPQITPSAIGRMLAPVVGHVKRKSAVRQAEMWNDALEREAGDGKPAYVVEVSERGADGLWHLVWCAHSPGGSDARD